MTATLPPTADAVQTAYDRDGFAGPLPLLSTQEAADLKARFDAFCATRPGGYPKSLNAKAHLLFPWLWDLVMHPTVLAQVNALLGPDVLCWAASFFAKQPGDAAEVPWHQDGTYWGLTGQQGLTVWIALSPSDSGNGGLRVWPGSHKRVLPHRLTRNRNSMLPAREEIDAPIPEHEVVDLNLVAGQMSIHHMMAAHGSAANTSGVPRIGFAIRYIAGDLEMANGLRSTATLVSGRDHGTFDLESAPRGEMLAEDVTRYYDHMRQLSRALFPERNPSRK